MDERCLGQLSLPPTQLTEGMHIKELFANLAPLVVIALSRLRTSLIAFVVFCGKLLMFLTVPSVGEAWAAGMGTGSLGFVWHVLSLGMKKAREFFPSF